MASATLDRLVQVHKALGHPARLRILAMLRTGELCACQITAVLGLAPSTVSAHVRELRRARLIEHRREGRWVHYRLAGSPEADEVVGRAWERARRDAQLRRDAAVVRWMRTVPVGEACSLGLDLDGLAARRAP